MPEDIIENVEVQSQIEQSVPTQDITQEYIEKVARSGDTKEMDRIGELLNNPKPVKSTEQPVVEQPVENEPEVLQGDANDESAFIIDYRGKNAKLLDPDGFLGRKSVDGVKKALAHSQMFIEDLQGELKGVRTQTSTLEQANAELKRQLESFKNSSAQPGETKAQTSTRQSIDIPEPPVKPDLPEMRYDWTDEHDKAFSKYLDDLQSHNVAVTKAIRGVANTPNINQQSVATDSELEQLKAEYRERLQKNEEEQYWGNIRKFQDSHSTFKTPIDIRDIHEKLDMWADKLAYAMGDKAPSDTAGKRLFDNRKMNYVYRYRKGDQEVLSKAEHIAPPDGHEQYYELADLQGRFTDYINSGRLGQKASLHDAYIIDLESSGEIENVFKKQESNGIKKGFEAIDNAMKKSKSEAIPVPNSVAQQTQFIGAGQITGEDVTWFKNVLDPRRDLRTVSDRQRYDKIGAMLGLV